MLMFVATFEKYGPFRLERGFRVIKMSAGFSALYRSKLEAPFKLEQLGVYTYWRDREVCRRPSQPEIRVDDESEVSVSARRDSEGHF